MLLMVICEDEAVGLGCGVAFALGAAGGVFELEDAAAGGGAAAEVAEGLLAVVAAEGATVEAGGLAAPPHPASASSSAADTLPLMSTRGTRISRF
ncbi:MAG: hypothetical protein JO065_09665 [Acidobacteria bacterium]|nr:hypothetical protein [Acidobacteriota bacterium]